MTSETKQMVSFHRELSDKLAEIIADHAGVCGGGAFEIWEAICNLAEQPAPANVEPVMQWSDDGLCWMDGEENEMVSARCAGWKTRTLYRNPAEQQAPVAVASRDESIALLRRIDGIGQNRAELIYSMGFRRHTEMPQP